MAKRIPGGVSAELESLLGSVRGERHGEAKLSEEDVDSLFAGVEQRVRAAEERPGWWFKTRSTLARRSISITSVAVLALCVYLFASRPNLAVLPTWRLAVEVGSLAVLLAMSIFAVVRPAHRLSLPRWVSWAVVGLALVATFIVAALPPPHEEMRLPAGMSFTGHVLPCLYMGLLLGVPVYALARLLDRGNPMGSLVAAAAAGVAGNMLLELHCPVNDPAHNLYGHFAVTVVFVLGVGLFELLRVRLRRRG